MRRLILLGSGVLLGGALAAAPLRAAPEDEPAYGAQVSARALFGGWVDPGRWTAVMVQLETRDAAPGPYRLGLKPLGTLGHVVADLELSPGGTKRVHLLLPVEQVGGQSLHLSREARDLEARPPAASVDLRDLAGRSLAGLVSAADVDLSGLEGLGGSQAAAVAMERPEALPAEPLALSSVDHLVLADLSWGGLEPEQQEALRQWVGLGGHLVVGGGPSAARTLGSIPAALRPAEVLSVREVADLGALGALSGGSAPAGPVTLAQLVPKAEAEILLSLEDGMPLAVRGRYGDGRVTFLALDPFQGPLRGWERRESLWQALAQDFPLADTALSAPPLRVDELEDLLQGVQDRGRFPITGLTYLLAAYILLVGPFNYLLLRRRQRLDLAWLTIPALSLVASGLTYAYGRTLHGGRLQIDELSLVRAVPGAELAQVNSLIAVFAPQSRAYSLEAAQGQIRLIAAKGRRMAGTVVGQLEDGSRLDGLAMDQWSQTILLTEAVIPWQGAAEQGLILNGAEVAGALRQPLGTDLVGAQILVPGGQAYLGDLEGDLPRQTRLSYQAFEGSRLEGPAEGRAAEGESPRQILLLQALRHSLGAPVLGGWGMAGDPSQLLLPPFKRPDALLVGWRDEGVLGLRADEEGSTLRSLSLVHGRLPIALGQESLRFIAGSATERGAGSAACGPGGAAFFAQETRAEFSFPLGLARPTSGRLWLSLVHEGLQASSAAEPPFGEQAHSFTVALWDGAQGQWLAFDRLQAGQSAEIPRVISRAQGMDQVRLRLEAYRDPAQDPELWNMFPGCIEPRLALQEGLSPSRSGAELAPLGDEGAGEGEAAGSGEDASGPQGEPTREPRQPVDAGSAPEAYP